MFSRRSAGRTRPATCVGVRASATRRGKAKRGRPPKPNAGVSHAKRPELPANAALHITLRVVAEIARARLRTREAYAAIREAAITVLRHEAFHIVQLSIQGSHVHLLVEAANREALSLGMKAFEISAAKHINAAMSRAGSWWERRTGRVVGRRRKGRVFADRYHEERITNARTGAERARVRAQQLAQAPRRSRRARPHVDDRSVRNGLGVRWLEGARGRTVRVEGARRVQADTGVAAARAGCCALGGADMG